MSICDVQPRSFSRLAKLVHRKSAQLDVLEHNFKDLKNKLAGFKKQMVGVCRKYDQNF